MLKIILGLLVALVLAGRTCATTDLGHYHIAQGYREAADRLIASEKLEYDCDTDRIDVRYDKMPIGSPDYLWYLDSYLSADVAHFNDEQQRFGDLFIIEGCRLIGVNPASHVVRLPRPSGIASEWRGQLRYLPRGVVGTLRGPDATVSLVESSGAREAARTHLMPIGAARPSAPTPHVTTERVLFYAAGRRDAEFGDVRSVGTNAVFRDRRSDRTLVTHDVMVRATSVTQGRSLRLEEADWLRIGPSSPSAGSGSTFLYTARDLARLLSYGGVRNQQWQRTTSPNLLGFVDDFVSVLNQFADGRPVGNANTISLDLSLDRNLQEELSDTLLGHVTPRAERLSRPMRASVAILDALTGRALALASYPTRPEQLTRFGYLTEGQRRSLLSNQNLLRHPIGSAGKPFWAAAIVDLFPFMGAFSIPAHPRNDVYPTAAGMPLARGYKVLGSKRTTPIDLRAFIEESDNKFLVDFVTTALALNPDCVGRTQLRRLDTCLSFSNDPLNQADRFSIGGVPAVTRPTFDRHLLADGRLSYLEENRLFHRFRDLFGVRLYAQPAPEPENSVSMATEQLFARWAQSSRGYLRPWAPLIRELLPHARDAADQALLQSRFVSVSPESVNLSVNTISDPRKDWVSLLLGGGTGLWNNIQLAESVARIVMGRPIGAQFISALEAEGRPVTAAAWPAPTAQAISEGARRQVLQGMSLVVEGGLGTANAAGALRGRLQLAFPQFYVHLYGKTGTPTVDIVVSPALQSTLMTMLTQNGLRYDSAARQLRVMPDWLPLARRLSNLGAATEVEQFISEFNADPDAFLVDAPGAERRVLLIDGGRPVLNPRAKGLPSTASGAGAVFEFAVVLTPRTGSRPPRVPSIAEMGRAVAGIVMTTYVHDSPLAEDSRYAVALAPKAYDQIEKALRLSLEINANRQN